MNWLERLGCYFMQAIVWLLTGLVEVLNLAIRALGAILAAALALLPNFPDLPGAPAAVTQGAQAVNWIVPVGQLLTVLAIAVTLWAIWLAISIALRWVRAVE